MTGVSSTAGRVPKRGNVPVSGAGGTFRHFRAHSGASGTGKEHIACELHEQSHRRNKPFVPVDCGTITGDLAKSEFLGTARGRSPEPTVTGADCSRRLIGVRCSWMRSATFPPRHRCSCCVPYRKDATSPSALPGNTPLMSVW